jgi:hypothetical protein
LKKLLLLILIFVGVATSVQPVRERVEPRFRPIRDYVVREVGPEIRRGIDPVYRWSAVQEMRQIARELRQRELSFLPLPQPREFQKFLERQHYGGKNGLDPWDTPYMLVLKRDSIVVISAGPDRERNTTDDIRVAVPRR